MQALVPIDQLFELNRQIYSIIDTFTHPLIVVGGQAVNYWVMYYDIPLTDEQRLLATSVDIDYCGSAQDFQSCSDIWNVKFDKPNIDDATPEIGHSVLRDKITQKIKECNGALFLDIIEWEESHNQTPNIVDLLEFPIGFKKIDFQNKRLLQHSVTFSFPSEFQLDTHFNLRILNPIGSLKNRLSNYSKLKTQKNPEKEVARIKLLIRPIIFFLTEHLHKNGYREIRKYIDLYMILIKSQASMSLFLNESVNLLDGFVFFVQENQKLLPSSFVEVEFVHWKLGVQKKMERKKKERKLRLLMLDAQKISI